MSGSTGNNYLHKIWHSELIDCKGKCVVVVVLKLATYYVLFKECY